MIGAAGDGVSLEDSKIAYTLGTAVMAWIWVSDLAASASMMAPISVLIPWIMRPSGVTAGIVMELWRNATVSETCSTLLSCGMIHWQR